METPISIAVFVTLMLVAVSCTSGTRRTATASQIGCSTDDVEISNEDSHQGITTWTAACQGEKFYCNATPGGTEGGTVVHCSEGTGTHGSHR